MSSYVNITFALEKPFEDKILTQWVGSNRTNFFKKHVLSRGCLLFLVPLSAITNIADTAIGTGALIATFATGGLHRKTFKFASDHLNSLQKIVARLYALVLRTLNPEAEIYNDENGLITNYSDKKLTNFARGCYRSDSFFKRHVASRLTYGLLVISSVITRVIDVVIGMIAAALSFLTLGKVERINSLAYKALQAPGIINDLFYCAIKLINPWAGVTKQ